MTSPVSTRRKAGFLRRQAYFVCAGLAVVLTVAALVSFVWAAGFGREDCRWLSISNGVVTYTYTYYGSWSNNKFSEPWIRRARPAIPSDVFRLWLWPREECGTQTGWTIEVPLLLITAPVVLFVFWVGIRARRRPLPGHCRNCGYCLTGNVSGRCPECGTRKK